MKTPINTFIEEMKKVNAFVESNDGIPAEADLTYYSDSAYAKAYFAKESELLVDKKIFKIYYEVPGFLGGSYETEKATQMILRGQDDSKMTIQDRPYETTIVPNIIKQNNNNGKYYLVFYPLKDLDRSTLRSEIMIIDDISSYDPMYKPQTPFNKMADDFHNADSIMEIARPATEEEKVIIKNIVDAHTKTYDTLVDNYRLISVDNIIELNVKMDKVEKVYEEKKDDEVHVLNCNDTGGRNVVNEMARLNKKDGSKSPFPSNKYLVWVQGDNSPHKPAHMHIKYLQDGEWEIKVFIENGELWKVVNPGNRGETDPFADVIKLVKEWFKLPTTMPGRIGNNQEAAFNEWDACND